MDILTLNWLIGVGAVLMHMGIAALAVLYVVRNARLEALVIRAALPLSFLLAAASVAMSLVYSEYFGIIPCGLCWLTRIFIYPQAILFAIAMWKKDMSVALYSIALSVPGVLVGLYHHYLQMGGGSILPCPAAGEADCAKRFLFEFGYVTFPLVAATTFLFIVVLMVFVMRASRAART